MLRKASLTDVDVRRKKSGKFLPRQPMFRALFTGIGNAPKLVLKSTWHLHGMLVDSTNVTTERLVVSYPRKLASYEAILGSKNSRQLEENFRCKEQ